MEHPSKSMKLDIQQNRLESIIELEATYSMPSDEEITETDLPLLSNVSDVRVHHYFLNLKTNFTQKVINGSVILFLEWLSLNSKLILDSCFLKIKGVYMLKTVKEYDTKKLFSEPGSESKKDFYKHINTVELSNLPATNTTLQALQFTVSKWSLTVFGWENSSPALFPSVLRIDYETMEASPSIHWRPSQGNHYESSTRKCLYTPAPPVNNRGLFPCQEPPSAVATWEVMLEVENEYTPLLTSDEPGEILEIRESNTFHYFYTSIPMPMSTFAMAVGNFRLGKTLVERSLMPKKQEENLSTSSSCGYHTVYSCRFSNPSERHEKLIPVRLFSLDDDSTNTLNTEKLSNFLSCSMQKCFDTFGPHPFSRLDLIIMPRSFPHMGLASPYMTFLSPSNFHGTDDPLLVSRIPHEICHSWFGLLIGALDWTEEWLSEGFATYCEDVVYEETYNNYFPSRSPEAVRKERGLEICLKFIKLHNELKNTENELQVMSRNSEDSQTAKNGLVPLKQFMHVHYYKGYLLLWHMSFLVGEANFLQFLKKYVCKYHGQLVTSSIFLNFYYENFKEILDTNSNFGSVDKLRQDWLESNALPPPYHGIDLLESKMELQSVPLFMNSENDLTYIKSIFQSMKNGTQPYGQLEELSTAELLILMEHVLSTSNDRKSLKTCYKQLTTLIQPFLHNPEVIHRWCELIILCKDKSKLSVVEEFLKNNIAMGVYLYGELMISEKLSFQRLAKRLFHEMEELYDMATKSLLREMLY